MTPGLRIGKYEVGVRLGKGSFGVVHLARDVELGREVAIKFLRPEFGARETIVQRFLQEARAAAKIGHAGIVTVFECGVVSGTGRHDGTAYIVMERLLGESLGEQVTAKRTWTYQTIVAIGRQLALALQAAHDAGIIHRDLKPDNVFLVPDAAVVGGVRAKILDFGIAKLDDPGPGGMHTHSKMILGTPRYMSPEQARSSTNVDARTDIYALGCMFYEMISGRAPFEGDTGDIMFHHQATECPPVTTLVDNVPAALDALLRQMLEKKPDKRPATMQAIDTALAAVHADAVLPKVKARARFVTAPVTTDVAEPPRPKRISAAGELSTKHIEDKPAQPELQRVKVDLDAVPSPSEEHTAPSQRIVKLLERASEPTFQRTSEPTFQVRREDLLEVEPPTIDQQVRPPGARSTLSTRMSTNAVWFAAAGGVLLLLALVMIVRCSGGGTQTVDAPAADAAVVVTADAAPPTISRECRKAQVERDWGLVDRCGRELAKTSPEEGKAMRALAFAEQTASIELRKLTATIATADLAQAKLHDAGIPPSSVYRLEADAELAKVRAAYVDQQAGALANYLEAHDCEAYDTVLTAIEATHGKQLRDEVAGRAGACAPGDHPPDTTPDQPTPTGTRPKTVPKTPPKEDPPKKADCSDTQAIEKLERRGDELMASGSYAAAHYQFEQVLGCRPGRAAKAYLAACKARLFPKARLYFRSIKKDDLAQICLKEGFDPRK